MPPWWPWVVHDVLEPLQTYPITASVNPSVCVGVGRDSSKSVTVCFNDEWDIVGRFMSFGKLKIERKEKTHQDT